MMTPPVTAVPYFEEAGSGDTAVLMLHGIGGGRHAFAGQMQPLAAAGYRAVAWDMPGYGHSALVDPYDFATIAEECVELIDVIDAERLVLLGHSLGGMVAQEVVARAPDRVDALILAGTSAAFGKPDGEWQRRFVEERTAPLAAGGSMQDLAASLVPTMLAANASDAARSAAVAVMAHVPAFSYRLALQALMGFDRRSQLPLIRVPTLLVAGRDDRNAPPAVMEGMAERIPGGRYLCLDDCGHLMNFERPDAFNAAVLDFLRAVVPRAT